MSNRIQQNISNRFQQQLAQAERTENAGFAAAQTLGDALAVSPGVLFKGAGSAAIGYAVVDTGIDIAKWTGERVADAAQGNGGFLDNTVAAVGGAAVLTVMGSEVVNQGIRIVAEATRGVQTFAANRAARAAE